MTGCAHKTTCPYCGVGCGVLATPDGKGGLTVKGDPEHPANLGRLCSKGSALGETLGTSERLLHPMVRGMRASWDDALQEVADRFKETIAEHGPDSAAFYVSGQLLTEDYYVANKLMKGFIGSANIDTNSRLCMASTVAGHKRAFGTDTVPGTYEDLELADLVVLAGSNLAWCHPVLYQRLAAAKAARPEMRVVVIDPRRTATCDIADMHLQLQPGSDVALWNGLLNRIAERGAEDATFVANSVNGHEQAIESARQADLSVTGISDELLRRFYDLWIETPRVVSVFSQGLNQSSSGADKVNALINCHLVTGRIGTPGCGPFSVTGQPNAMGGREVGGLANMLACHLDIENAEHRNAVRTFWDAPTMPADQGLKAVDLFDAVKSGQIKALWVMCTNPVVSMPDADAVRDAIRNCALTVVSDVTGLSDTAKLAEILLPATGWSEKDGTVTNSDRTISRQRGMLPPVGEARHDWAVMAEVGRRMGWQQAFDYSSPAEIFREHAALSGIAGRFGKDFDISGLSSLNDADYDGLAPTRWPVSARKKGGRFFGDGQFFSSDLRANMLPVSYRAPAAVPSSEDSFVLNTGRIRDQWHTMTRTGLTARLLSHMAEPYLEIHPKDADRLGLEPAQIAEVKSEKGKALLRVLITDRVRPGDVFAPIHWTGETSSAGRIDAVIPAVVDPISGQPESKAAVVTVRKWAARWFAYGVSTVKPAPETAYWARARRGEGWQVECADLAPHDELEASARSLLGLGDRGEAISFVDGARATQRMAFVEDDRLIGALFSSPEPVSVARDVASDALGQGQAARVLAGRASTDQPDSGATVCACLGIGLNTISRAIVENHLVSVAQVTELLGAGGECGSCRPELAELLRQANLKVAAE